MENNRTTGRNRRFLLPSKVPWEKPLVENTCGLLRRWLKRRSNLYRPQNELDLIAQLLNTTHAESSTETTPKPPTINNTLQQPCEPASVPSTVNGVSPTRRAYSPASTAKISSEMSKLP